MAAPRAKSTLAEIPAPQSGFTTWHITVGTFCSRLHGGILPTVSRDQNHPGQPFIPPHPPREEFERDRARGPAVILTLEQCLFIEETIPALCDRGGWNHRTCSAEPPPPNSTHGDHFHVLLDAPSHIHGKQVRELLKRWLTQALDARFGKPAGGKGSWWAEGGSTKAVADDAYRVNAHKYIERQRATPTT